MKEGALHELPGGWMWTRLGEICCTTSGGTPSRKNINYFGGNIPWLKSGELNNGLINSAEESITEDAIKKSSAKIIPKGTLLIALYGATVGKLGILGIDSAINQAVCAISTKNSIDQKFLFWYLNGYRNKLLQARVGGAQPNISQQIVNDVQIPLPPLPEQRAIVSKIEQLFSDLDDGIENFKKAQAQLKLYRQSVLKAACEGKLVPTEAELARAQGREYEAADVLLARILKERREKWDGKGKYREAVAPETNGLSELPEGWCLVNVGQITDSMKNGIYKPKEFYAEEGFACLRMYNIDQGKIVWKNIKRMNLTKEEIDEYLLVPDDILVNRVNSRELVGKAAVISSGIEKCIFESKNVRVRVLKEVANPYYLCYHFTLEGTEYFNRNSQQVVGMASISQPQIARFPVLLPPLVEQRRIVAEVERRLSVCDKMEATITESLQKAESLRQSILKKAFEGKLLNKKELEKARNAPDWEPAEKLLERIQQEKQIKENNNKQGRRITHG
jgi:type I restriction enzyme S subunit